MKKILIIEDYCEQCGWYDHDPQEIQEAWGKPYCHKLKQILEVKNFMVEIPDNCPLETYTGEK